MNTRSWPFLVLFVLVAAGPCLGAGAVAHPSVAAAASAVDGATGSSQSERIGVLLRAYRDYLQQQVIPRLPRTPEAIHAAFEAYQKGQFEGLPVRRQTEDSGMIGVWQASHELYATAALVKRTLGRVPEPAAALEELREHVLDDVGGLRVGDHLQAEEEHFAEMVRRLDVRIAVSLFRLGLALDGQAAPVTAAGGDASKEGAPSPEDVNRE